MIVLDNNIEYLLAFISAILGLSVPIMLQVIERVDQHYGSTRLAECLKSEKAIKRCFKLLIASLVSCTYAVFCKFPPLWDCWLINNSADLIALSSCMSLIGCFLCACRIILIYYNPEKLQNRILKNFEEADLGIDKERIFLDWVDLTKAILEVSDREPAFKVYDVIRKEIEVAFDKSGEVGVSFPTYLVRGITSINENLCLMQRRPYSINNGNTILKSLIIQPEKLSDEAYILLWKNLQLQLFYNQEEWIYEYWSAAVQVFDLELAELYPSSPIGECGYAQYDRDTDERRNGQRYRFKEFHIALCATILNDNRYDLFKKLTSFYRAMTPECEYPLVPSSPGEVLDAFRMVKESSRLEFCAERFYPFRGMKGIVDDIILASVKRYLTFLYIRAFSNIGRIENMHVNYPLTLRGLKRLDEDVDYLIRMKQSILGNRDLMSILSFDSVSEAKKRMELFLFDVKSKIKEREEEIKKAGPYDPDIIRDDLNRVKEIVDKCLADYNPFVAELNDDDSTYYYLRGISSCVYPNEAFLHDGGISYVNVAESVANISIASIQQGFASVFFQNVKQRLNISSERVFEAIDKLVIDDSFIILAFSVYLEYYYHKSVDGLKKEGDSYYYRGIPIICLDGGPGDFYSQMLFILKKGDLPTLAFLPPVEEHIGKYKLELLDDRYKLYGSIVKLYESEELMKEVENKGFADTKGASLFNVFINARMMWKPSIRVLGIKIMYALKDNGTTGLLKDIVPFDDQF